MEEQDVHFRHILLYYFRKGKNVSQAHNDADDVKSHLIQFFAGKNQKFYEYGIMTLPQR
ncbi:hypothetical protein WN51_05630 [Melipona quadrifasciata]|uniref:Mos1 transposase HTH domain-containing protein n=1 Tax=Melipona quadrifasciata TaxID=166423 RepID=A0A0N1IT59_9HYME|nr:hypothetical protein WN51_05630 [Melipona quadrifasciata]